jgi:hypothetical protein
MSLSGLYEIQFYSMTYYLWVETLVGNKGDHALHVVYRKPENKKIPAHFERGFCQVIFIAR